VINSDSEEDQQHRNALQRVVEVARRGQARLSSAYRQETAALGIWLRSHLFQQGSKGLKTKVGRSLRYAVTARCLRQRQEVHRNGSRDSSTAVYSLQRAARAIDRKRKC
jgi:hypothetical protein